MTDKIDDKLQDIENTCNNYLRTLGVEVRHDPDFDNILQLNIHQLHLLQEDECGEYAVVAALYSTYLQIEFNKHSRKNKWANHNLDIVIGKYANNYGDKWTKYEEKRGLIICENEYAKKLNEVIKESMVFMESLNFISRKIEAISNTLTELQRTKRKQQ